jgi:hypothetical protein
VKEDDQLKLEKIILHSSSLNDYQVEIGTTTQASEGINYVDIRFGPSINEDKVGELTPYAYNTFYGFETQVNIDKGEKVDDEFVPENETRSVANVRVYQGNRDCMNAWYDDPARVELKTTKEAEIVAAEEAEVARIAKEKADAEQKKIDDAAADAAAAAAGTGTGTGTTDTDNPKVTSGNVTDVTVKVTSSDDDGLGAGAIVGIILAVLIVVAVVVALVLFRKKLPCFKN